MTGRVSKIRAALRRASRSIMAPAAMLLLAMAGVAMGAAQTPPAPAADSPGSALPDRPGKAAVIASCGNCHQPDIVLGQKRDAAAWRELVDQMVARGANVEDARYEEIIAYLAQIS
jgi:mono/diheme cytochrome c family protein